MRSGEDNFVKRWSRQLAFDLPRTKSNAASRKRVLLILLSVVTLVLMLGAFIGFIAYFEFRFAGRWGAILLALTIYGLALGSRRWMKRGRKPPLTLNVHTVRCPSLREGLLRQRTILASLVDRADFEARSAFGIRPEGGIRARLIERLRHRRLWDAVPLPLQNLLSEPEGSWSRERIQRVRLQLEAVRVLSWALQEDYELHSLRTAADMNTDILRTALTHADRDSGIFFVRNWTEIEAQLVPARIYLERLHNELIKRNVTGGTFDTAMEERIEAYMTYAASIGEVEMVAEDLPLGGGLVAEASSEELVDLQSIAAVRYLNLQALRAAVESGTAAGFEEQNAWIAEKLTLHM
jgi:hypothetical protein